MLPIVTLGNHLLAEKSVMVPDVADINETTMALIRGMFDTLSPARGIGLAAVQVGKPIRLFVTQIEGDVPRVFINPDIVETSLDEVSFEEGCLSVPGINAHVMRPSAVKVQAWNERGRPFVLSVDGWLARVIQHEYDHLNGKLFIDRIDASKRRRLMKAFDVQRVEE